MKIKFNGDLKVKKTGLNLKFLTSLLCVACILSSILLLNSCKGNQEKKQIKDMIFTLNDAGTEYAIAGYKGTSTEITVPAEYEGLPVTSVAKEAFVGNTIIESIILPDSIKDIYESAFKDCSKLKSVDFPATLNSIGLNSFENCVSLTAIEIPEGIKKMPTSLFNGCATLESIKLPASAEIISFMNFMGCDSLKYLEVASGNKVYHSNGNCIIKTADKTVIAGAGQAVIPSDESVNAIGEYAFFNRFSLKTIEIPENVKTIGEQAFSGCTALRYARIDGATEIGESAFFACSSMRHVIIPATLTKINDNAFSGCSFLQEIYYKGSVTDWNYVEISYNTIEQAEKAKLYFYSEEKPTAEGHFWHYIGDGIVSAWEYSN